MKIRLLLTACTFWFAIFPALAADTPAGQVILAIGSLKANSADNPSRTLQRGAAFYQNDTLITGTNTQAKLRFTDGTLISLTPNTQVRVDSYRYEQNGNNSYVVSLATGGLRTVSGAIAKQDNSAYQVRTPVATIAVRGTEYSILYRKSCKKNTRDKTCGLLTSVWKGTIELDTKTGKLLIGKNEQFQSAQIRSENEIRKGSQQRLQHYRVIPI